MSATDYLRLCKDKNNLAKNVHCELNFCKSTSFFFVSSTSNGVLFHSVYNFCIFTCKCEGTT